MERFWKKVDLSGPCWLWCASKLKDGYGYFKADGRTHQAHRYAWALTHGPIPSGVCVLHTCDNPGCVRPEHLFLGTHVDNMQDKVSKGRHPSKLTRLDVLAILSDARSHREIASMYGVSSSLVGQIQRRTAWRHI